MTQQIQSIIDTAWDNRANINMGNATPELFAAIDQVIAQLNNGQDGNGADAPFGNAEDDGREDGQGPLSGTELVRLEGLDKMCEHK